ncbi:uncharacterized protein LOC6563584 [Drosophila grimshawi]|uniref:uncharacterized protein LOC6563584 n=1 Tax=Drosophila grimshawi TaxID=7222 RepID=UPI000C871659|nr:uncharacterized protein LOC6563584 [Drosophila grimshawi]
MKRIIIVLLFGFIWMHSVLSQFTFPPITTFDCFKDVLGMPLNLQALSGDWYEMGRVPKTDVMKCLVVSVPQKADENLELHLEYISTLGGDIQRVRETVQFPMDNFTKNSIFHLFYSGSLSIIITYKVIYTDYKHMTLICGYAGISPVPLIKLLSRQRQLDQRSIDFIQAQLVTSGVEEHFMWTEQSPEHCGTAALSPAVGLFILLALAILFEDDVYGYVRKSCLR